MKNYNIFQRFLHDLVLSQKFINKSLFELEKIIYLKNEDIKDQPHVFITGLPRAGTTSVLNFLFSSGEYASLTYRNMPFIFSPNLSKIFNKKNTPRKLRLHGDGIAYDINSPEAFDEIFFKNEKKFIENELLNYLKLILLSKNKIKYLSKNNLNYRRVNLINSILPKSIFLILIREPLQQANSLLNQHLNFSQLQKEDDFIRRYMNYLNHNEFGLNHEPWNKPCNYHDLNQIDYWMEQWILFYQNILNNHKLYKNCYIIYYEELTNIDYIKNILEKINFDNINNLDFSYFKNFNKKKLNVGVSQSNYKKAISIYNELRNYNVKKI